MLHCLLLCRFLLLPTAWEKGSAEEEVAELGYLQLIDDPYRHEPACLCVSCLC